MEAVVLLPSEQRTTLEQPRLSLFENFILGASLRFGFAGTHAE